MNTTNNRRGVPGATRNLVIEMLKNGKHTTEGMAAELDMCNQATWLIVKQLRADGKPARIVDWVTPRSGKSLVPLYAWEAGYDVDRPAPKLASTVCTPSLPHRDWPVMAMFGERGMASSVREQRV